MLAGRISGGLQTLQQQIRLAIAVSSQSQSLILVRLHSTWSTGTLFSDGAHGEPKKVYLGHPPPSASIREGGPEGAGKPACVQSVSRFLC